MQEEAAIAVLAEEYDKIQAKMDADEELAARLTLEEQEKYKIKEMARLLAEFFKKRKKQLAAERAEAIRNKAPIKTQVRNRMIAYLKHMGKYTHRQLKNKDFEEKLEEEYSAEKEELRANMDIVPKDDITINVESLATKVQIERDAQEETSKEAVIKELDNIQAMIEGDEQLAAILKTKEQEQFSIEEKSRMLVEMIAERKRGVTRVYRPKDITNDLNIEFNIDVSYKIAWKGKQLALKLNQRDLISSFAQLSYSCYNLKLANENTVTRIDTDHEGRFKMLFIAFGAAVRI
nr:transposase, MuDR, MULE transposase domain protein [Tanacetum cinerariifolium]